MHTDYDQWQSLSEIKTADNGGWVGYKVNLQDGDAEATIVSTAKIRESHSIHRGENLNFSAERRPASHRKGEDP